MTWKHSDIPIEEFMRQYPVGARCRYKGYYYQILEYRVFPSGLKSYCRFDDGSEDWFFVVDLIGDEVVNSFTTALQEILEDAPE